MILKDRDRYIKCASLAKRVLDDLERRDQYDIIPAQYEAEWRRWLGKC
jgi:valyl-tRNA synthetase